MTTNRLILKSIFNSIANPNPTRCRPFADGPPIASRPAPFSFLNLRNGTLALVAALSVSHSPDSFALSTASTFYVATYGSDSNSCDQAKDVNTPRRTLWGGVQCLNSGDRLEIRGGTYTKGSSLGNGRIIPSGSSWANTTTISNYNNEPVTLEFVAEQPESGYWICGIGFSAQRWTSPPKTDQYIVLENLTLDGRNCGGVGVYFHGGKSITANTVFDANGDPIESQHILLQNLDIKNFPHMGIQGGGTDIRIVNTKIHDIGVNNGPSTSTEDNRAHCVYWWGHDSLFDGVEIYRCHSIAMQIYNHTATEDTNTHNILRNSWIHDNFGVENSGVVAIDGSDNQIYNNIISSGVGTALAVGYCPGSHRNLIYNNTVYNNTGGGIIVSSTACAPIGNVVKNNIAFANPGNNILVGPLAVDTEVSNNLTSDPKFIDAANSNFRLLASSPAIDQGADLSGVGIVRDFDGSLRPADGNGDGLARFDIGAFEYGSVAGPSPSPSPAPAPTPEPTATDTTPPTVAITSPKTGDTVPRRSSVTISAEAQDNVGIARVEFLVNGSVKCADTTPPYSCEWTVPARRGKTYNLRARAFDAIGNSSVSETVTVRSSS